MKKFKSLILIFAGLLITAGLAACGTNNAPPFDRSEFPIIVIYDCLGGKIGDRNVRVQNVKMDSPIPEPGSDSIVGGAFDAPAVTGYRVQGWFFGEKIYEEEKTDKDADTYEYADKKVIAYDKEGAKVFELIYGEQWDFQLGRASENMTLYAKYDLRSSFAIVKRNINEEETPSDKDLDFIYVDDGASVSQFNTPSRTDYTFRGNYYEGDRLISGFYLDPEFTREVTFPIKHNGGDEKKRIYIYTDWIEGNWKLVSRPDDLKTLVMTSNYYIMNDLDFTDKQIGAINRYNGIFEGNGHRFTNLEISVVQQGQSAFGIICGQLDGTIRNLTIEDAVYEVTVGNSRSSTYTGLLAGRLSDKGRIEKVTASGSVTIKVKKSAALYYEHYVDKLSALFKPAQIIDCVDAGITANYIEIE